jgi:hypothetical protein
MCGGPAERRTTFERRNNCAQGNDPDAVLKDTQAERDFLRDDGFEWISAPTADELARRHCDEATKAERRKGGETTKRRIDVLIRHGWGPQRARQVWSTTSAEEMLARLVTEFKPSSNREWELET